jgi:hypothetical protein
MGLSTLQNAFTVKKKTDRQTERHTNKQTETKMRLINKPETKKKLDLLFPDFEPQ